MSNEKNPEETVDSNGLDNWYGTPKKVEFSSYLAGFLLILFLVLTMGIFAGIKNLQAQAAKDVIITCLHQCNETFEK